MSPGVDGGRFFDFEVLKALKALTSTSWLYITPGLFEVKDLI